MHSTETISSKDYSIILCHAARGHVPIYGEREEFFSIF
jgi:hypothetical protein